MLDQPRITRCTQDYSCEALWYTGSEEGEQDLYEPGQPAELVTWELSWKSSKGSELDSESPNFVRLTKSEVESAYIQELDLENYSFALPTSMAPCDH